MLKNKILMLTLFLLATAAGVWYPVSKIIGFEFPSSPPAVFRFSISGILYYPSKGSCLVLPKETLEWGSDEIINCDLNEYIVLESDENGLATVVGIVPKPVPGKPTIRALEIDWENTYIEEEDYYVAADPESDYYRKQYLYNVVLPFDYFDVNEEITPEIRQVLLEAERSGKKFTIVAKVYRDGNYQITDLEIDGTPIREFLKIELGRR